MMKRSGVFLPVKKGLHGRQAPATGTATDGQSELRKRIRSVFGLVMRKGRGGKTFKVSARQRQCCLKFLLLFLRRIGLLYHPSI